MKQTKMSKQERIVEGAMTAAERAQTKLDEETKRLAAIDAETTKVREKLVQLGESAKTIDAFQAKALATVRESEEAAVAKAVALVEEKLRPFEDQLAQIEAAKATVEGSIALLKTERDAIAASIHTAGDVAWKGIVEAVDAWRAKTAEVTQETERQLVALMTARGPVNETLALCKAALGTLKDATSRFASLAASVGLTSTPEPATLESTEAPVSVVVEPKPVVIETPPPRRLLDDLRMLDDTRDIPIELLRVAIPPKPVVSSIGPIVSPDTSQLPTEAPIVSSIGPIVSSSETPIEEPTAKPEAT